MINQFHLLGIWTDESRMNELGLTPPLGQDMTQGQFLSGV